MKLRYRLICAFLCFVSNAVIGQQSDVYTSDLVRFNKALALYNSSQYLASQNQFNTLLKTSSNDMVKSDCAYYIANSAVRLNQRNAETLMQNFVDDYPSSTKRNSAFVDVADYYFENGKYSHAQKWYAKVDKKSLSNDEVEKFNFNNGYAYFKAKNYDKAKAYLSKVETSKKYGSQAKYYIGFMAYEGDDYDAATNYFEQVEDNDAYKEKLSYYQADLNFKLGKFEKAIELAKSQLDKSDATEKSELNKVIGESYFNLEKYNEAIPYLKDYKGKKGKWNNTDYYQLGYAYYKQNNYADAISEFNKIIEGKNAVAQNAYYHLGESYIKLDKKQEALNAFRNASQMDFDDKIKEDAGLNYAKISYDIGNPYQSVPQVLTAYINDYPQSPAKADLENLLVDSYITSKNYKEALVLLKGKNSSEHKAAYQKVAFYRGLELYNDANFTEAQELFETSLSQNENPDITARATFWNAECHFNASNFEEAKQGFTAFKNMPNSTSLPEAEHINYNLAYANFKLKNYSEAISNFNSYINSNTSDLVRKNDAYLRLADANFVSSNYSNAITAYDNALKTGKVENDYAAFQKAMSYGYLGQVNQKTNALEQFLTTYPNSKLQDDAKYTLGDEYIKQNNNAKSLAMFDRLAREHSKSPLVSKAILRQGLIQYNSSNNEAALTKLKKVASDFPGTPEANQAVSTARLIYIDMGRVNDYANWVRTLNYVEVTDADLDNATYEAAEKQYLDNNTSEAIKQFNTYLKQFPKGLHALPAHFYIAQLYYKTDKTNTAETHFNYVSQAPPNEFTEEALLRLSEIQLKRKDWQSVLPLLQRLETEASFPQNVVFAQSNAMKAYYELENYNNAVTYANKVLSHSTIDARVKSDAHVIIARSAIKNNNETAAQQAYALVEQTATGETAAEALFYNAYFKNKNNSYEASNTTLQRLVKDYAGYKYYVAKGLVVMAKNFYGLNDAFQATYILENVIKNSKEYDDVMEEAQAELNKIKAEEAKTNNSVVPQN